MSTIYTYTIYQYNMIIIITFDTYSTLLYIGWTHKRLKRLLFCCSFIIFPFYFEIIILLLYYYSDLRHKVKFQKRNKIYLHLMLFYSGINIVKIIFIIVFNFLNIRTCFYYNVRLLIIKMVL